MPTLDEIMASPDPFKQPASASASTSAGRQSLDDILKQPDPLAPKTPASGGENPPPSTIQTPADALAAAQTDVGARPNVAQDQGSSDEGFWHLVGRSALQGVLESSSQIASGAAAAVPSAVGGSTVAQQAATLPKPDAADEITKIENTGITSGFTNPRWWGVKLAHGIASGMPVTGAAIGGGLLGGAVGGPIGGGVGATAAAGLTGTLQQLIPAYQGARARGLDHDAALTESLESSGVAGAFAAAMGLVGGVPLTGVTKIPLANGTIITALKRPITEAMVKMGLVEPALMVAQHQATKAVGPGGWITPDEAFTDFISGAAMGGIMHATTATSLPIIRGVGSKIATPTGIEAAFKAMEAKDLDTVPQPRNWSSDKDFYNRVSDAVATHADSSRDPAEWLDTMKGAHADAENVELPPWLADNNGKVNKDDLLAYLGTRQTQGSWRQGNGNLEKDILNGIKVPLANDGPHGTDQWGAVRFWKEGDLDNNSVFHIHTIDFDPAKFQGKGDPWKIMALTILEKAANWGGDRISWAKMPPEFGAAVADFANKLGITPDTVKLKSNTGTPGAEYPSVKLTPALASGVRLGTQLFSRLPGTYVEDDPYRPGRQAISAFLDEAQRSPEPLDRQVDTGNGGSIRLRKRNDNLVDFAGMDTSHERPGEFNHYLEHLENEVHRRGMAGTRVENVPHEDLAKYLEEKGYAREPEVLEGDKPSLRRGAIDPKAESRAFPTAGSKLYTPNDLRPGAKIIAKAVDQLRRAMGMKVPLTIQIHDTGKPGLAGEAMRTKDGYHINLFLGSHETMGLEGLYSTAAHEFGHVVMWHFFDRSPVEIKNLLSKAFTDWKGDFPPNVSMNQMLRLRDNAVKQYYGARWHDPDFPLLSMTPERQRYWAGFEEWFAENVARWATTSEKPMTILDRTFRSLGQRVLSVLEKFKQYVRGERPLLVRGPGVFRKSFEPVKEMKDWLDSLVKDAAPFAADIFAAAQLRSLRQNKSALTAAGTPSVPASPITLSTASGRGLISRLFGRGNVNGNAMAAHADRFNIIYKYAVGLPQLVKVNPHIEGLQRYGELMSMLHLEKNQIAGEAETTLHFWRALQGTQSDNLAKLMDDYMNMTYRTPAEVKAKVTRKPNKAEFENLVRTNKVTDDGLQVFQKVVADFDRMLTRYQRLLEEGANEIKDANGNYDPVAASKAISDIGDQIAEMRKAPYFPAMRFGKYTLTVRNKKGSVVHFETFESARRQRLVADEAKAKFPPDHSVRIGELTQDQAPLVGMPPGLLQKIADKLSLSPSQKEILEELKFEYMPAQSFSHRFRRKRDVPGYSTDFLRAYAHYMFHGANYFTRAKYVDALREAHRSIKEESQKLSVAVKRDQIANYVSEHLAHHLNPTADFAALRSAIFHYALGFSPAAASLNLSQTILGTYPYLASKFGSDARAIASMANASRKVSTFYSKGNILETTEPEMKGIREAVRQGLISETQANTLAATADGRVLLKGFGGNRAEKAWNTFSRASQFMFEMTEQTNRRVAFRAAWDMAMNDPANRHVANMVRQNKILFDALRLKGFTEQEAGAFVTAKDAVESTQYVYAPYARPRIFRGKLGSLFVFHSFTQNTLFFLKNNPGAATRMLLILGFLAGPMGLPGAEDTNGLIRGLAWRLFHKDFDIEDQAREFVLNILNGGSEVDRPGDITMKEGGIRPDILLHGISRVGYGIPAIMDQIGSIMGMGHVPMPVLDRHSNLSMGNLLPLQMGQVLAPEITGPGAGPHNVDSTIATQGQRAAGAIFGFAFALYKAIEALPTLGGSGFADYKRWESVMPTALRNISQAFRFYSEGKARNSQGAAIARFDVNQPEDAMEILGRAMGYQPAKMSTAWDYSTAEREQEAFWQMRKEYLMRSAWTAKQSGDSEAYQDVLASIRAFNKMLPAEAKAKAAITADALRGAFEARAKGIAKTEQGLPSSRSAIPLSREVRRLYPEAKAPGRGYPPQGGALGK